MPEGPEVYFMTHKMNKKFISKKLLEINILGGRYMKINSKLKNIDNFREQLPLTINEIKSKGKFIYITFKNSDIVIFNTLGRSGCWNKKESNYISTELVFENMNYYFNDKMHEGTIKITDKNELMSKLKMLGPDIIRDDLSDFIEIMRKKKYENKMIDEILTNQKIISGIGNYLVAEILYSSKVMPTRLINTLSDNELIMILKNIKKIIKLKINSLNGKSIFKYNVYSEKYDQKGNNVIIIKRKNNRKMYYVKEIQF
jgi:formamidopyrimidine-DNA glycosylase